MQFEMISKHPYKFTSDDVLFPVAMVRVPTNHFKILFLQFAANSHILNFTPLLAINSE